MTVDDFLCKLKTSSISDVVEKIETELYPIHGGYDCFIDYLREEVIDVEPEMSIEKSISIYNDLCIGEFDRIDDAIEYVDSQFITNPNENSYKSSYEYIKENFYIYFSKYFDRELRDKFGVEDKKVVLVKKFSKFWRRMTVKRFLDLVNEIGWEESIKRSSCIEILRQLGKETFLTYCSTTLSKEDFNNDLDVTLGLILSRLVGTFSSMDELLEHEIYDMTKCELIDYVDKDRLCKDILNKLYIIENSSGIYAFKQSI